MTIRYTLFLFLSLFSISFTQNLEDFDSTMIEGSTAYHWGKGRSTQAAKAEEIARAELSEKIVTFLYSSKQVQTITSESGGEVTETDYINTYTKRFSALHLTGLEKKVFDTGYGFVCWVYISKENWEKSLEQLAGTIETQIASADAELAARNYDMAIDQYHKAYLLSYTSPKELFFKGTTNSLRSYAESALRKIINELEFTPGKPIPDPGEELALIIPLKLSHGGKSAKNIAIYSTYHENWYEVVDGSIDLAVNLPKLPLEQINLEVKPFFRGEDYLREIDMRFPLKFSRKVDADFRGLINLDFSASIKNGVLSCETEAEYLNVVDVDWFYGDGKKYTGTALKTDAGKSASITVRMRVNNSEDLTITKSVVNPDWKEPVVEKPKEKVTEKPKDKTPEPKKEPVVEKKETPPVIKPELPQSNNTAAVLSSIMSVKDNEASLDALLDDLKQKGWITVGKKSAFADPSKCYILVFDGTAGKTVAILEPGSESRKDIISGELVTDIAIKFKGKTPIWFQIL